MCGICGIIDSESGYINEELIRRMADKMTHRGPDDGGIYIDSKSTPRAALGHRRLSIIDLSPLGHQPMSNEDNSVWIILNGEIYNYKLLREDLEKKGHKFRSKTDTETVLHLYEDHKEDCVKYLRGMFAFAIWDLRERKLFLSRDRAGKKPLLYHNSSGRFCFASEFSALLESGLVEKRVNREAIHDYLTFGYIPDPLTIYEGVFKLPPAHTLVFKDGKAIIKRYWQLDYSKKIRISEDDAAAEVLRLLEEAVKIRLYSDVALGAFLSGGIDSSAVVGLMSRQSAGRVKTFSIGFEEKSFDELKYAKSVSERFGTEHTEFIVKPDALGILPLLVERYGEPYADSSCIPTYYVSKETRSSVTVALNGDGGDELFAGYERYQAVLASEIFNRMPLPARLALKALARYFPDSLDQKNKSRRIKRFFDGVDMPLIERYLRWIGIFQDDTKKEIYSADFRAALTEKSPSSYLEPYFSATDISCLDRLLAADTHTYLPGDLLVKVDITSMANSLEVRSPFLDHKLMEFAASLPADYKMKHFVKKYILKKALKGILPRENIDRPKMGFGLPIGKWFRYELKGLLRDMLLSPAFANRGYFNAVAVRGMVEEHISAKKDHTFRLWALLMLELWHKRFMDQ